MKKGKRGREKKRKREQQTGKQRGRVGQNQQFRFSAPRPFSGERGPPILVTLTIYLGHRSILENWKKDNNLAFGNFKTKL